MGRTYIVEENVGQYLLNVDLQGKAFASGLLIGQSSSQKDYVILATRTPPREEQNENLKHPKAKLDNLDEEWATEHANQLVFAVEKSLNKKRLWNFTEEEVSERVTLYLCSSTKKVFCRTYDVHDPKLPLPCLCVIWFFNFFSQKKSSRGNAQATRHSFDVRVLTQLLLNSDHRSTATVQICSGSVNLKGAVKCRAYIHSNKPKVKDAVQAVKRDILNTVADRCEILFEDLLMNEIPEKKVMSIKFYVSSPMNTEATLDNTDDEQPKQPIKTTIVLKIQQNIGVIAAFAVAVLAAGLSFHYFSD
ncbi:protein odr-4 homolog [Pteropus vampyrus]|uniref:Protein odr-4 homolog n=1 Tax=Pteropus vampyrus TaxID=132908 RepID=A0A6P6CND6_PTEVA|nr:protein odr-4 homolog [Pteropus vampyrus]